MFNQIKIIIDGLLRRNKLAGRYTIEQLNEYAGLVQLKIMNRNIEVEGLQVTSFNADKIGPTMTTAPLTISSGQFDKPEDFLYIVGMTHSYSDGDLTKFADIDLVRDNEFYKKVNSRIVPATLKKPFAKWTSTGWKVKPDAIVASSLTYIKNPPSPEWGFTTTAGGRTAYDESSTVDFTLPETMKEEIVNEMLAMMGVSTREGQPLNYALKEQADE